MKIKQLVCIAVLASPFMAHADTLAFSIGGGIWNESPSGNFQTTIDPENVDIVDNLFWDDESQGYFFVTVEHFVPIIPNVRLMHTKIDHSGSGNSTFTFDGIDFTGNVNNDFSMETTDLIAYYEVLDNIVSLDIGLNIRNLKIDYTITSTSTGDTTSDSISETIPMLYAMVGASPWPDLIISAELSYIGYSDSGFSDLTAKIAYTTIFMVGFEAGYRKQNFELDDIADTNANLDFDGIFAGVYLKL